MCQINAGGNEAFVSSVLEIARQAELRAGYEPASSSLLLQQQLKNLENPKFPK